MIRVQQARELDDNKLEFSGARAGRGAEEPTSIALPYDFHRPGVPAEVARHAFELKIPSLEGTAPESMLGVAFGVLLSRYSGQPSISITYQRGARARPWRLEAPPERTARELLKQAGEALPERAPEAGAQPGVRKPRGTAITWLDGTEAAASLSGFDLNLAVAPSGNKHLATFLFDSNRFRPATIERLAGHLGELLARIPEHLDGPLRNLSILPPNEKEALEALCDGPSRPLGDELAHQLFERQAASAPDAPALRFREQVLSYRELNTRANALAHLLIAKGIGAECRVMVCVEPSCDILVAILGILKAGAVYVPLDPTYPAARIQALLADVEPKLLLTRNYLIEKLEPAGVDLLALDGLELNGLAEENPGRALDPEQTACIYYTSGTTGLPKGAMVSQRNLKHYLRAAQERYRICASDVMPAVARFSFSISMFELMSPLVAGGTVVLLEREHVLDPARMCQTLSEVTLFHIGPSLLKSLIAHIKNHFTDPRAFSRVRHASSGGDHVPPEILEALKTIFSEAEVFVIYGCSEISCMGCTYPAPRDRRLENSQVGRPFENVRVRVLDGARNLLPAGVVGEVYFSGDGVVKGYLHRPELTEEKFIQWDGRRWYRTGDLGRMTDEGWLQLVGRQDFQVQLRGMRVELAEVEHHLRRAPAVTDGVVVAKELQEGEKTLVAYLVGDRSSFSGSGNKIDKAAIRQYLREQLPEYMVPSIYVELEQLPLNHNLKLDRRALPEPKPEDRRVEGEKAEGIVFREPQTHTEQRLAALWRDLLGVQTVSLDDHFFDLGGDSLRGIDLILKVESELGVVLDGLEIVREPLGTLAEVCDQRRGLTASPGAAADERHLEPVEPIELFHFGAEQSLYGVLHAAPAAAKCQAALICAPLGAEAMQAHFVLQRLARQLALHGVPALRFDYFGHGDSLGESLSGSRARWESDILSAYQELKRRTGARDITVIGVRLGAALLGRILDRIEVARWVLWDPVCEGAAYLREMSQVQNRYLRNARYRRRWQRPASVSGRVELGGVTYSTAAVRELGELTLELPAQAQARPLRWLETSRSEERARWFQALSRGEKSSRMELLERDCGWGQLERIEQSMADVGISNALLGMALEP